MKDYVIIADFAAVAGGFVRDRDSAGDVDVIVRSDQIGDNFLIPGDSIALQVRNALSELLGIDRHSAQIHLVSSPQGPHSDYIPVADLVLRFRDEAVLHEVKGRPPNWPTKPRKAYYSVNGPNFTSIWEEWGKENMPFAVEPKWNGWRIRATSSTVETESGDDISDLVPEIVSVVPDGYVLDGELMFVANGQFVPRHLLPGIRARPPEWVAEPKFFDVLQSPDGPTDQMPYHDRRELLEEILPEQFVTPAVICQSEDSLGKAWELAFVPGSEGVVMKPLDSTLTNPRWAKIKRLLKVSAVIVEKERRENGFVYDCQWADGGTTGRTMVTKLEAEPGDTITVVCQELVPVGDDLRFQNAVPISVGGTPMTKEEAAKAMVRHISGSPEQKYFAGSHMPFVGIGTKARVASQILELFTDHDVYCEPFVGAGGFFFRKPKVRGIKEVIGDLDRTKVMAYRFLRDAGEEEIRAVAAEASRTRPTARWLNEVWRNTEPKDNRDALYRMIVVRNYSRGADSPSMPPNPQRTDPQVYVAASKRMKGVTVVHQDAFRTIQQYDSPTTLFYIDPPYPTATSAPGKYEHKFSLDDFRRLLQLLKRIKGKFILSCLPSDLRASGVQLPSNWKLFRITVHNYAVGGPTASTEYLVTNYTPKKGEWLQAVSGRTVSIQEKQIANEGETRQELAARSWESNWHTYYPEGGRGKFVVQRHIRGLEEDEVSNPPAGHSVHHDFRFTAGDGSRLFGFTVFTDSDPFDELAKGKSLRCIPKLPQPPDWLSVGVGKPHISSPGEPGATTEKYARFDAVEFGNYEAGVWNKHFVEVFLDGRRASGRLVFQRIGTDADGSDVWIVRYGGSPLAESTPKEKIASRLEARGHRIFIYRAPGGKPEIVKLHRKAGHPTAVWRAYLALIPRLRSGAICYKILGDWIILPVTNRYRDLQGDVVTEEAVKGILSRQPRVPVRLGHISRAEIADIQAYVPIGKFVFGIAKFRDTPFARFWKKFLARFQSGHPTVAPLGWATSIGYVPVRKPGGEIQSLELIEVSILPAGTAANPWTSLPENQEVDDGGHF